MAAAATSFKALAMFVVMAFFSMAVSAQDLAMAPAAAPAGMDSGDGYSLPVSGVIVCASVVVSMIALIKH